MSLHASYWPSTLDSNHLELTVHINYYHKYILEYLSLCLILKAKLLFGPISIVSQLSKGEILDWIYTSFETYLGPTLNYQRFSQSLVLFCCCIKAPITKNDHLTPPTGYPVNPPSHYKWDQLELHPKVSICGKLLL